MKMIVSLQHNNKYIMNNFKKIREVNNYSTSFIAKLLHIDEELYMRYEDDVVEMPYDVIDKLAVIYDCTAYELLNNDDIRCTIRIDENAADIDIDSLLYFKDMVMCYNKISNI